MAKDSTSTTTSAPAQNRILDDLKTRFLKETAGKDLRRSVSPPPRPGMPSQVKEVFFQLTVQELLELCKGKSTELAKVKKASVDFLPEETAVVIAAREVAELLN